MVVALFFLRVLGEPWETHFPPQFPDALNPGRTDTYYAVARLTPFSPAFYWAPRPVAYPALLWLLGRSSHLVVLAQMAVYCAAFGFLGVTSRQLIRTRLIATVTVIMLVLIAMQGRFALWNTQILTESLAVSLGIVMIAMWWRVAVGPSPRRVSWAWVWTVLWVLVRDAHAVPVVIGVIPLAAAMSWRAQGLDADVRRRLRAGAAIALLVCGYVYFAQKETGRTRYSFYTNIAVRVLPDPELRAWFVRGGMPLDAALLGRQGKTAFDDDRLFERDPSLARFRGWAEGPGARRMALSLVVRAPDWYGLLSKQWDSILGTNYDGYDSYDVLNRLPARTPFHLASPGSRQALFAWLALTTTVSLLAARRGRPSRALTFAVIGLLLVLVEVYATFVADPLEVERHLVGALARLSVMLVVCAAVALDTLWRRSLPERASERDGAVAPG